MKPEENALAGHISQAPRTTKQEMSHDRRQLEGVINRSNLPEKARLDDPDGAGPAVTFFRVTLARHAWTAAARRGSPGIHPPTTSRAP